MATTIANSQLHIFCPLLSKKSHFYLQIQKVLVYLHHTSCLIHKEYYKYGERCNDN